MDMDEILPPKKPQGPNFEVMSIAELEAHIAKLEAEIAAARAMIENKRKGRNAAESFFKS